MLGESCLCTTFRRWRRSIAICLPHCSKIAAFGDPDTRLPAIWTTTFSKGKTLVMKLFLLIAVISAFPTIYQLGHLWPDQESCPPGLCVYYSGHGHVTCVTKKVGFENPSTKYWWLLINHVADIAHKLTLHTSLLYATQFSGVPDCDASHHLHCINICINTFYSD